MCPECIATATQIAAGATSVSAMTAYVVRRLRTKIGVNNASSEERRIDDEHQPVTNSDSLFTN